MFWLKLAARVVQDPQAHPAWFSHAHICRLEHIELDLDSQLSSASCNSLFLKHIDELRLPFAMLNFGDELNWICLHICHVVGTCTLVSRIARVAVIICAGCV